MAVVIVNPARHPIGTYASAEAVPLDPAERGNEVVDKDANESYVVVDVAQKVSRQNSIPHEFMFASNDYVRRWQWEM